MIIVSNKIEKLYVISLQNALTKKTKIICQNPLAKDKNGKEVGFKADKFLEVAICDIDFEGRTRPTMMLKDFLPDIF